MRRMEGKVALVTGAARGTGEVVARLFAREGAKVALADLRDEQGQAVAKDIGAAAHYVHLDVGSEDEWSRAVDEAVGHFGRLDVLVNNAGVLHLAGIPDTTLADYERVLRVNQIGTFLGMRAVVEPLKAAGRGAIVNVSSVDGLSAKNGGVAYSASKWAVRGMSRVAALELGRYGIRVNTVCPEAGNTEMIARYVPDGIDPELVDAGSHRRLSYQAERRNRDRLGDVAHMILFLASDESLSCTGGDFPVDSGNTAGKIVKGAPGA